MKPRTAVLSAFVCALVLIFPATVSAQDFRGAVTGTVTDSTGALLPGVTVTVTNLGTNVPSVVVTDAKGIYKVPYLNSGTYTVEAALEGFRTAVRRSIEVHIGATVRIDFKLEPGGVREVIDVVATAPLLDTTSGVTGQVIESKQIERLPLGDGTAYMLTRLAPGLSDSSDLHFARPMDNGNLAGITANGVQGGNEFTLDGAPNRVSPNNTTNQNNFGVVGFSPPSASISEFKVETNAFDAQSGHTAGATVNLALKSGTNNLDGSFAYFNRSDSRTETPLLSKRAGAEKPSRKYDRYTGMISGPIIHDKTFIMVSFERLRDVQPEPASYTVPTLKMRNGDLSEWLGTATIYDPLTATGSNNARTAFAGNVIPADRINAIARAYALMYPEPNRPGLEDNYFTNQLRPYDYNAFVTKVDHNFNDNNRTFMSGYWNKRQEDRYNWALGAPNDEGGGKIKGFKITQGYDYRSNTGITLGHTTVASSSLVLDARGGWSKFGEWRKPADEFDPASLGFSSATTALFGGYKYLPFITFGGFSTTNSNSRIASLGAQRSDWGTGFDRPFKNISFVPTANWLWASHSIRGGYEFRRQQWQITTPAYGAGRYHFNGAYTRANNSAGTNVLAQEWAQFLLGLPTSGTNTVATPGSTASQFEIAAAADYRQTSHSLFVQDDWHLTSNLTLNLGLRLEYEVAMSEAKDRNLGGFDPLMSSPIESAATAKYAASPIPEIAAADFKVRGGLQFAHGGIYDNRLKPLPRAAFSYQLGDKTVIRGGVGQFSYSYYFDAGNQTGFSQPTAIVTTDNNGKTFLTDLTNPLPSGQLVQPTGSSLGAATGLGLTLGTIVPSERKTPYYNRVQLGVQREIGTGWRVEAIFLDQRGQHLPVTRELNTLPFQYLSTSRMRDTTNEAYLAQSVPNPFQGLLPGSTINGSTITRGQLLRPFPQYLVGANNGAVSGTGTISVGTEEYIGSDSYRAGTIIVEKRFRGANSLVTTYTRSRARDKLNFLNPSNGILEDRVSPNDRPNRFTLGGTLELPFGRNQKWGSGWNRLVDAVAGGWTVSATYQYQTGFPLTWNNNIYYDPARDPKDLRAHIGGHCEGGGTAGLDCTAWDTSGFYIAGGTGRTDQRIQLANNVRYFPSTLPHVRTDDLNLLDVGISKSFDVTRGIRMQIRADIINALNYTVLWNPNLDPTNASFGKVNQDRNNPRDIQLGAKFTF